ncbi:ATP-dependent helicase [Brevibacillus fluminis]|uniref:DNA 3'-5' helicase n=1 Tax=Brevibacillus fluminis TaxID=511487 RepID=A0A3M8DIB6_9BACL|nr:ATP-dependent helicase [Brevibacillus fluminis]RNB87774.1 ATP-dependent helicase [Brevibacillus fluminis]
MKTALLHTKQIQLTADNYDQIAYWRHMDRQGKLLCPHCSQPVTIVAGISTEPHFVHRKEAAACEADETIALALAEVAAAQVANHDYRKRLVPRKMIQQLAHKSEEPLHPEQERAVHSTEGPLLILAGAGSGKTRVMTARAAHLIQEKGVDSRSLMMVTFTTKAAEEMKHRLRGQLSPAQLNGLITGTFHSIFFKILLHERPGEWDPQRLLKQDWLKLKLLRESGVLAQMDPPVTSEAELSQALSIISRWKNEYLLPEHLSIRPLDTAEEQSALALYPLYEEAKQRGRWFDFDDMLIGCYQLLRTDETVRNRYQSRIRYLMIDEFQDINRVQYETVKLFAAPENNLCVIGDDDQSIYAFRGSNPQYILGFSNDFPTAQTITLEVNYRSRPSIVGLGYSLIGNNQARHAKKLKSFHGEDGENYLFYPDDEEEQASRIVDEITHQLAHGASADQMAILFRTHESARPVVERLWEAKIPFAFTGEEEPFYRKQAVRWGLGYLRLAKNPDDADALRDVLPTLYIAQSQWNAIRSQAILDDVPLAHVLPRLPGLKSFQKTQLKAFLAILDEVPKLTPAQALEFIYEDGKLRDYVKKKNKERPEQESQAATDDLQQLYGAAKRHETIDSFLHFVTQQLNRDRSGARQNAEPSVQVMSIHRAKGLEFDTVFLLDLVEGSLPHEYALDELRRGKRDAIEEERRLMYVAITRARHQLFVGIPQERFGRKTRVSRFIKEMAGL